MSRATFSTVSGKLLTDVQTQIPEWIDGIDFQRTPRQKLDVAFDQKTVNAKRVTAAQRDGMRGHTRAVRSTFNEATMRTAALARLSAFLGGHRFDATEVAVDGDQVTVHAVVDHCPFTHTFSYTAGGGQLVASGSFHTTTVLADTGEERMRVYPFTEAGLIDSLNDADDDDAVVVRQASGGKSVMTRIEIVRRCGNSLKAAKEAIEKYVNDGLIVAVGSNEYASIYDMTGLFPNKLEKFQPGDAHTADFVDNRVSTGEVQEKKTHKRVAAEAAAQIARVADLRSVDALEHVDGKLRVEATVVDHGQRQKQTFTMNMNGNTVDGVDAVERQQGDERLASVGDEQAGSGHVYTNARVRAAVDELVDDADVDALVDDWCARGLAAKLSTGSFASTYTLAELFAAANVKLLDDAAVAAVRARRAHFGDGLAVDRVNVQDGDLRNAAEAEVAEDAAVEEICSAALNDFTLNRVARGVYELTLNVDGKAHRLPLTAVFDDNGCSAVLAKVNNADVPVEQLAAKFATSDLLRSLAAVVPGVADAGKVLISRRALMTYASAVLGDEQAADVVDQLVADGRLTQVDSQRFASAETMADLLRSVTVEVDPAERNARLAMADRVDRSANVDRVDVQDGDLRYATETDVAEDTAVHADIAAYFKDFTLRRVARGSYTLEFSVDGRAHVLPVHAEFVDGALDNVYAVIDDEHVSTASLAARFTMSPLLSALVDADRELLARCANRAVFTYSALMQRLGTVMNDDNAKALVDGLVADGRLVQVGTGRYAAVHGLAGLLRDVNVQMDNDALSVRLANGNRVTLEQFTRVAVADGDTRKPEARVTKADALAAVNKWLPAWAAIDEVKTVDIDGDTVHVGAHVYSRDHGVIALVDLDGRVDGGQLTDVTVRQGNVQRDSLEDCFFTIEVASMYAKMYGRDANANKGIVSISELRDRLARFATVDTLDDDVNSWLSMGMAERVDTDKLLAHVPVTHLLCTSRLRMLPADQVEANTKRAAGAQALLVPMQARVADGDLRQPEQRFTAADAKADFLRWASADHIQVLRLDNVMVGDEVTVHAVCRTADGAQTAVTAVRVGEANWQLDGIIPVVSEAASAVTAEHGVDNAMAHVWSVADLRRELRSTVANVDDVLTRMAALPSVAVLPGGRLASECTLAQLLTDAKAQQLTEGERAEVAERRKASTLTPTSMPANVSTGVVSDGRTSDELDDLRARVATRLYNAVAAGLVTSSRVDKLRTALDAARDASAIAAVAAELGRYDGGR